jgi:hypothetical protein
MRKLLLFLLFCSCAASLHNVPNKEGFTMRASSAWQYQENGPHSLMLYESDENIILIDTRIKSEFVNKDMLSDSVYKQSVKSHAFTSITSVKDSGYIPESKVFDVTIQNVTLENTFVDGESYTYVIMFSTDYKSAIDVIKTFKPDR